MARVTEASVNDPRTRRRAGQQRLGPFIARRPKVDVAASAPVLSVVLLIAGSAILLAPADVQLPGQVLALAAVALGGWLTGRRPGPDPADYNERVTFATFAERQEVIRAALALAALRGDDGSARSQRRAGAGTAAGEPREAGEPDSPTGRAALHAVADGPAGESLAADADADAFAGALLR